MYAEELNSVFFSITMYNILSLDGGTTVRNDKYIQYCEGVS